MNIHFDTLKKINQAQTIAHTFQKEKSFTAISRQNLNILQNAITLCQRELVSHRTHRRLIKLNKKAWFSDINNELCNEWTHSSESVVNTISNNRPLSDESSFETNKILSDVQLAVSFDLIRKVNIIIKGAKKSSSELLKDLFTETEVKRKLLLLDWLNTPDAELSRLKLSREYHQLAELEPEFLTFLPKTQRRYIEQLRTLANKQHTNTDKLLSELVANFSDKNSLTTILFSNNTNTLEEANIEKLPSENVARYFKHDFSDSLILSLFLSLVIISALYTQSTNLIPVFGLIILPALSILIFNLYWPNRLTRSAVNNLGLVVSSSGPVFSYDYSKELPASAKTFVVIPSFIRNTQNLDELIRQLEVLYLANRQTNLFFALLLDFPDRTQAIDINHPDEDKELEHYLEMKVAELNSKYEAFGVGQKFYGLVRLQTFNSEENCHMGWERKRGKLIDFNNLLARKTTNFKNTKNLPDNVTFVTVVDEGMKSEINMVSSLVGALSHPLNRPIIKDSEIISGYTFAQPRVFSTLESHGDSKYTQLASWNGGYGYYDQNYLTDKYFTAYGSGLFIGKGAYNLDTFQALFDNRFPDNNILSHDYLEGLIGKVLPVESTSLAEEFPSSHLLERQRRHRWLRGDLQAWIYANQSSQSKSLRNRLFLPVLMSLNPVAFLAVLLSAAISQSLSLLIITFVIFSLPDLKGLKINGASSMFQHLKKAMAAIYFKLITLADNAIVNLDAITRSTYRMLISHRSRLEWRTAHAAQKSLKNQSLNNFYQTLSPIVILGLIILIASILSVNILGSILGSWLIINPLLIWRLHKKNESTLTSRQTSDLLELAKKHYNFFGTWQRPNGMVPDFIQKTDKDEYMVGSETSPTNIGMSILAHLSAHQLELITEDTLIETLETLLNSIQNIPAENGFLFNWISVDNFSSNNSIVSSVDIGNYLASLLILRQYLLEITDRNKGLVDVVSDLINRINLGNLFSDKNNLFNVFLYPTADTNRPKLYNNLASETNTLSYLGIAMGQIPYSHWNKLSRKITNNHSLPTLATWHGSIFELGLSTLWFNAPKKSLLSRSLENTTIEQSTYKNNTNGFWGYSESATNNKDINGRYLYKPLGLPSLSMDTEHFPETTSPYSVALAFNTNRTLALREIEKLTHTSLLTEFGFYDALDHSSSKPIPIPVMYAHHQGITLVAITNLVKKNFFRELMLKDPNIASAQLLLEERADV